MNKFLRTLIISAFIITWTAGAATLSGEARTTVERTYTFETPDDVSQIALICLPNNDISTQIYVDNILFVDASTCSGGTKKVELKNIKSIRYVFTSTSPTKTDVTAGIEAKNAGIINLQAFLPPASACSVSYEPVVNLGIINPTEQFNSKRIITSGESSGVITLKPSDTDATGAFISSGGNSKIYLSINDSTGAEPWDNAQGVWSGSNTVDYYLHSRKTHLTLSPGIYNGSMTLSLTCQ